ncbi:hypothetical protein [Streptomyces phaeochromogenes]
MFTASAGTATYGLSQAGRSRRRMGLQPASMIPAHLRGSKDWAISGAACSADSNDRAFQVAWGPLSAAHRQTIAVVLLHRFSLGGDISLNQRAHLEHAARIWWLGEDGADAVETMNRA